MRLLPLICWALITFYSGNCLSQTTIWFEDFEDLTEGDESDAGATAWTQACTGVGTCGYLDPDPNDYFEVRNTGFHNGARNIHGRDMDGELRWQSELITISGYANVSGSAIIGEFGGDDGSDYVRIYYSVDAGAETLFTNGNQSGNFGSAVTATFSGLSGNNIRIIAYFDCNGGNDYVGMDDILITGELPLGHTGPGGVGSSDGTGDLELWLMGDSNVTGNSPITAWGDLSGNANDVTVIGGNPSVTSSAFNGFDAINFDGTDYVTCDVTANTGIAATAIFAGSITGNNSTSGGGGSGYGGIVTAYGGTPSDYNQTVNSCLMLRNNNNNTLGCWRGAQRATYNSTGIMTSASPQIFSSYLTGTTNFVRVNGQISGGSATTGNFNFDEITIAKRRPENHYTIGNYAEIIYFSTDLNTAQLIIVENYLSAKYGNTLDANDLYTEDDNGFDFDVAGIGQASDGTSHTDAQGTGIVRINSPSDLANSEFFMWGHDNGDLSSYGVTDYPSSQGVEARLERVWRPTETGEVGTVTISFDLSDVFGSKTAADLRLLIDTDNDGLFSDEGVGGVISGAVNTSGDVFEWTGIDIDNAQRFTIGSVDFSSTPLPITLSEFKAVLKGDVVSIRWSTMGEINNDFFTVEKSSDINSWETVSIVEGAGNSRKKLEYEAFDGNLRSGIFYYRLKQTDYDGKSSYSNIESISYNSSNAVTLEIVPNPAKDIIWLEYNSDSETKFSGKISILNSSGNIVQLEKMTEGKSIINISSLPSGIYFLILRNMEGVFLQQTKLIVI